MTLEFALKLQMLNIGFTLLIFIGFALIVRNLLRTIDVQRVAIDSLNSRLNDINRANIDRINEALRQVNNKYPPQ